MPTPAPPAAGYVGWHRASKRSPWRAVVQADNEDAALCQLLDAVAGGDKTVLPAGVDPNNKPPTMGRRRF